MKLKTLLKKYNNKEWRVKNGGRVKGPKISTIDKAIEIFKKMGIYETWDVYELKENEYSVCHPNQKKKPQNYYVIKFTK